MSQYKFTINGNEYNVDINSINGDSASVTVNGITYTVESGVAACAQTAPQIQFQQAAPVQATAQVPVQTPAAAAQAPASQPSKPAETVQATPKNTASAGGTAVTAPLPGVIIEISVKTGDTVKAGQQVAILEAMKMENAIEAPQAGTVTAIHVNTNDSVLEGAPIVTIA